jgi:UDP-N-acetylmuramate dehydrogenase
VKAHIQEHVPLAPWTTFGIGGPARYFIEASSEDMVVEALAFAKERNAPLFVLGGGSNLLVADRGFPGVVLKMSLLGIEFEEDRNQTKVHAGAGVDWDPLVADCVERNLAGIECLSGIPGSVGGTPVQNVGAYGQEVSDVLLQVRAYDRQADAILELSRDDCKFTYRSSLFNTVAKDRYVVLNVTYSLTKCGKPAIRYPDVQRELEGRTTEPTLSEVRNAVRRIRSGKAMLLVDGEPDCRSAGSFFKNPFISEAQFASIQSVIPDEAVPRYPATSGKVKIAAAWLIERSGLSKGYSLGSVGLSNKHTLALVNKGGASAEDVLQLARQIQSRVRDKFGIELVPEPVFVGFN